MKMYQKSIHYTNELLLEQVKGPAVLDVGGAENLVRANVLGEAGHLVTIVDLHEPWGELHANVNLVQMSVEQLTNETGLFDDIVISNALEHFDSPRKALHAVQKVMKNHARIHILTPNRGSLNRRIGLLMGKLSSLKEIPEKEIVYGHKHTFSVESLQEILESTGFRVTVCKGIFLKPVPTEEMILWPDERIDAFFRIADQIPPELCHEVYFQAITK